MPMQTRMPLSCRICCFCAEPKATHDTLLPCRVCCVCAESEAAHDDVPVQPVCMDAHHYPRGGGALLLPGVSQDIVVLSELC